MQATDIVQDYKLANLLGKGARSKIYKAYSLKDNHPVVIKFVPVDKKADKKYVKHLDNEHSTLRRLHNTEKPPENIVKPLGFNRKRRFFSIRSACLIMEYIDGKNLVQANNYSLKQMMDICKQVAQALLHTHDAGFIHGDVKPNNILVTPSNKVKLIDFGFAAPIGSSIKGIKGTAEYLAPEQAGGTVGEETDVFNFGASAYWLLTGQQLPFIGSSGEPGNRIPDPSLPVTPPSEINPKLPEELSNLILRCCNGNPHERPPMRVVHNKLEDIAMPYEMGLASDQISLFENIT